MPVSNGLVPIAIETQSTDNLPVDTVVFLFITEIYFLTLLSFFEDLFVT